MEIKPQDLGEHWHIAVVRYRALGHARFTLPPKIGVLGRIWASGLDIPEPVAATTLPLMNDFTAPMVVGVGTGIVLTALSICTLCQFASGVIIGSVIVGGGALWGCMVVLPRRAFRRLHQTPVRSSELEALKGVQPKRQEKPEPIQRSKNTILKVVDGLRGIAPRAPGDELETEFLRFVQDVLDIRSVSSTTESEVRRVVHAIGEATGSLPDPMLENDSSANRVEGAEANLAGKHAWENHQRLLHRIDLLRDELITQIKAVRTLLPTLGEESLSSVNDFSRLVSVATKIESIASEVSSLTEARQELALTLYPRLTMGEIPHKTTESATLRQG